MFKLNFMLAAALLMALSCFFSQDLDRAWGEGEFPELERYVCKHPGDQEARQRLAEAYARHGLIEEAVAQYLKVLVHDPENTLVRERVQELIAIRMPEWLPAGLASALPFSHKIFELSLSILQQHKTYRLLYTIQSLTVKANKENSKQDGSMIDYGYVFDKTTSTWIMKIRSHRQVNIKKPLAENTLAALLYFYSVTYEYAGFDPTRSYGGPIDAWLITDGSPGAKAERRNLYLYAVDVERSPAEWLREIAHEYGHIAFPGIGGFDRTNDPWADGELGELLFIKWLAASKLVPSDALSWSVSEAEALASPRREELMARAAGKPDLSLLRGKDTPARDYFLGLALRVEQTAGPQFLGEALARSPRGSAIDFTAAVERLEKERGVKVW